MFSHVRNTSGFTLVELIIGMLIFSIGMTGILALLHSTINNSLYSRHEVVAANLLREQVELIKNIRNTNTRNFLPFNSAKVEDGSGAFGSGIYIIENNYSYTGTDINQYGVIQSSPVFLSGITFSSPDTATRFQATRLFLDAQGRYTHTHSATGTTYASYIIIRPLEFQDDYGTMISPKKDAKYQGYILDARVLVQGSYGRILEYDLKSTLTDWK